MSDAAAPAPISMNVRTWTPRLSAGWVGAVLLILIAVPCFVLLPWSLQHYDEHRIAEGLALQPPGWVAEGGSLMRGDGLSIKDALSEPMGTDLFGRSLLWRCLLGGAISLGIGGCAALLAVGIGVTWGATAGYIGGRVDSFMMRIVDVLYGLPYILLVVLMNIALKPIINGGLKNLPMMTESSADELAGIVTLLAAIGGVSWLTMARVIRGQVLSLRSQPFMEAARSVGTGHFRTLRVHLLPNLVGPIVVYATLTVPQAILQESFLSFLGIGVQSPVPSWGNLASEGLPQLNRLALQSESNVFMKVAAVDWWMLFFPCLLLGLTLMALNFLGDALRNRLDPRRAKT